MLTSDTLLRYSILFIIIVILISDFLFFIFDIDLLVQLDRTQLCVFRLLTGKKCPGCGMTHAFLTIGRGQFVQAFRYNIFAIPFFIFMIVYLFNPKISRVFNNKYLMILLLVIAMVYWIFRNVTIYG